MLLPAVLFAEAADWSGNYTGYKDEGTNAGGTPVFYSYFLSVKKGVSDYSAEYSEDGYQTMVRIEAKLVREKDSARLIFLKWGEENTLSYQGYKSGDVIMRIKKKKNGKYEVRYLKDEFKKDPIEFEKEKPGKK